MKNVFYMILITTVILFTCLNVSVIADGCRQGISLWYSSIVPVLLPFMLLTSVILDTLDLNHMTTGFACILSLIIGLFCGFPTGTLVISFFYKNNNLSRHTAQTLLPICNNVSPMFLYGYIYSEYLYKYMTLHELIICLYVPQIACTMITFCIYYTHINIYIKSTVSKIFPGNIFSHTSSEIAATSLHGSKYKNDNIINSSIYNITAIGIFIVIFSITSNLITHFFPYKIIQASTSFLEISSGINSLASIDIPHKIKTVLFLSLTAFGGLSALFQSYGLIQKTGLSFFKYISAKCLYSLICAATTIIIF